MGNYQNIVIEKIHQVLQNNNDISFNDDLSYLGMDSFNSVKLIVKLEEVFDITFDDEELLFENFSTINKILECVKSKLNS
ncbi:acyl carrier protein [Paenibacillus chitinolyticus]|uniref:acyl carrier protein n=1 Tax=Paenibacillus chitinolyticus TaxID=79263 RepID=UPI0036DBC520